MAKQSKWLKWKIGGGVIFSMAVMFNIAKADPEFIKAVQAAQDTNNSSDMDNEVSTSAQEENHADQNNEKNEENFKPQTVIASATDSIPKTQHNTTVVNSENHQSKGTVQSKKVESTTKRVNQTVSKPATVHSQTTIVASKQQVVNHSAPAPVVSHNQTSSSKPPADIPSAPPTEDTTVAPPESSTVDNSTVDNTDQSQIDTTPVRKKSHSRSSHS
ncbi:hypothetical protein ACQCN2_15770 [Brevibacillus ginsengisoli]|uniref:hypothetical protein n=1 Tax=Brevibacillus ginsengisoli TaxID=363854 RepID=UPI003CE7E532